MKANDHKTYNLEDDKKLAFYELKGDDQILVTLKPKIQLFIRSAEPKNYQEFAHFSAWFKDGQTTEDVKKRIQEEVAKRCPKDKITKFEVMRVNEDEWTRLEDDQKLGDADIKTGDRIRLHLKKKE